MSQNDLVLSHSAAGAFRGKSRRRRRSRAFDGSRLRGEWRPRDRPRFRPTYRRSPTNGMNVFASIYDVGSIGPSVPSYIPTTNLTHLMFPGGAMTGSVSPGGTRSDFVKRLEKNSSMTTCRAFQIKRSVRLLCFVRLRGQSPYHEFSRLDRDPVS